MLKYVKILKLQLIEYVFYHYEAKSIIMITLEFNTNAVTKLIRSLWIIIGMYYELCYESVSNEF